MTGDEANRGPKDRLTAAAALVDRARTAQEPGRAVQAMVEIARAAEAFDWDLGRADAASTAATLRAMVAHDRELFDWAVLVATDLLYRDDPYYVVEALLARSGYQVLRELGAAADSRLDPGHLADADAEMADVIEERGLGALVTENRPRSVPPSHTWWFVPSSDPEPRSGQV